jgi:phosphoribosylglycinamide formyltransferase 2
LKSLEYAVEGSRDVVEVIVEAFVKFNSETLFNCCSKIIIQHYFVRLHYRQYERGDYMESWQPASIEKDFTKRKIWLKSLKL